MQVNELNLTDSLNSHKLSEFWGHVLFITAFQHHERSTPSFRCYTPQGDKMPIQ